MAEDAESFEAAFPGGFSSWNVPHSCLAAASINNWRINNNAPEHLWDAKQALKQDHCFIPSTLRSIKFLLRVRAITEQTQGQSWESFAGIGRVGCDSREKHTPGFWRGLSSGCCRCPHPWGLWNLRDGEERSLDIQSGPVSLGYLSWEGAGTRQGAELMSPASRR